MISPTVGRVVHYYPPKNCTSSLCVPADGSPLPALIARVWTDRCINIGGFDANGAPFSATSVNLLQDGDVIPELGNYACWMPYQKGQAAKTEELQAKVDAQGAA